MNDSNKNERMQGKTLFVLFLAIVIAGFLVSMANIRSIVVTSGGHILRALNHEIPVSSIPSAIEKHYNSLYSSNPWSLDAFSFTQRILGKHETRNFGVLKTNSGQLYLDGSNKTIDYDTLNMIADQYKAVYDETNKYGGYFLYVQAP